MTAISNKVLSQLFAGINSATLADKVDVPVRVFHVEIGTEENCGTIFKGDTEGRYRLGGVNVEEGRRVMRLSPSAFMVGWHATREDAPPTADIIFNNVVDVFVQQLNNDLLPAARNISEDGPWEALLLLDPKVAPLCWPTSTGEDDVSHGRIFAALVVVSAKAEFSVTRVSYPPVEPVFTPVAQVQ